MKRGRPFEPGNKFGRGRPKGSPNKKTHLAQKIFEENFAAIMALAVNTSREDRPMLRMLAGHIVSRRKDVPIKLGRLPLKTFDDLDRASELVLKKATSGKLTPSEALEISSLIEIRRRVLFGVEIEQKVNALENGGRLLKEVA